MKAASIHWLCAVALYALPLPALAAERLPTPICASPEVLTQVSDALQRAGRTFTLETDSIGQAPTANAAVVECAVRVHTLVLDTTRTGLAPLDQVTVFTYALRLQENGIFLHAWGEKPL